MNELIIVNLLLIIPENNFIRKLMIQYKMNSPSSKRKVSNDKEKVYRARKQVIVCESIIRKVLAIQNCFAELNSHIKDSSNSFTLL